MDTESNPLRWFTDLFSGKAPGPPGLVQWLIIGSAAVVGLLVLHFFVRRLFARKPVRVDPEKKLRENLADYPPAPGAPGPQRLMVEGLPARVRLVVVAPVGKQGGINEDGAADFLDQLVRGMGAVVERDKPRIRLWPPQLSNRGFGPTFHRLVSRPEDDGEPSHWVMLAGPAKLGKWQVLLGMALYADKTNTLGRLHLEPNQWAEMLRIEKER